MKKIWGVILVSLCPTLARAGTVEAQKDNVEVFAAADKSAAVLTKLKKGETLKSAERSGMYWQVQTQDGKSGFVSVLGVKVKAEDKSDLSNAMREAVKNGRSQSTADGGRTRSAVMGVRGLDDTNDTGMAASLRPNLQAVYQMEDYDVPKARLDQQAELVAAEVERRAQGVK
jgi:hypothetical protein